nr:hypothetical protein GCM10025732_05030 [Glycomyces mayteni]
MEDRGAHQGSNALDARVHGGREVPAGPERDHQRHGAALVEDDAAGVEQFGIGAQLLRGGGGRVGYLTFGREERGVHRGLERGVAEALGRERGAGGRRVAGRRRVRQRSLETGHLASPSSGSRPRRARPDGGLYELYNRSHLIAGRLPEAPAGGAAGPIVRFAQPSPGRARALR